MPLALQAGGERKGLVGQALWVGGDLARGLGRGIWAQVL